MKKILVIEDNVPLQAAYRDILTRAGYSVIDATIGEQGLNRAHAEQPDLVILDVLLPGGIDGFEVLERLKKDVLTKSIPVIMMTNLEEHLSTSLEKGAVWYFVKANTALDDLVAKVREIIGPSV